MPCCGLGDRMHAVIARYAKLIAETPVAPRIDILARWEASVAAEKAKTSP